MDGQTRFEPSTLPDGGRDKRVKRRTIVVAILRLERAGPCPHQRERGMQRAVEVPSPKAKSMARLHATPL